MWRLRAHINGDATRPHFPKYLVRFDNKLSRLFQRGHFHLQVRVVHLSLTNRRHLYYSGQRYFAISTSTRILGRDNNTLAGGDKSGCEMAPSGNRTRDNPFAGCDNFFVDHDSECYRRGMGSVAPVYEFVKVWQ